MSNVSTQRGRSKTGPTLNSSERRLRLQPSLAHHQLGILNRVQRGAFPEVVPAHPEGEAIIERGVDADAADATFHLPAEIERRRVTGLRRVVDELSTFERGYGGAGGFDAD